MKSFRPLATAFAIVLILIAGLVAVYQLGLKSSSASRTGERTARSSWTSNVGIFRSGFLWLEDSDGNHQFNDPPDKAFAFGGIAGDIPITGDWNGSGTSKVGVYRPASGTFVLDYDGDLQFTAKDRAYRLIAGLDPSDIPVVGDWSGDGKTKVGLFRNGYWMLDIDGNGVFEPNIDTAYSFGGVSGDVPVVGDWTGDGRTKLGVFRQGFLWILDVNGNGLIDNLNREGGDVAFGYGGSAGDVPVVGDWNGDRKSDVGVFREGYLWLLDANGNHKFDGAGPGGDWVFAFGGLPGDKPIADRWAHK